MKPTTEKMFATPAIEQVEITPQKAADILRKSGLDVTIEQAKAILQILLQLSEITMHN